MYMYSQRICTAKGYSYMYMYIAHIHSSCAQRSQCSSQSSRVVLYQSGPDSASCSHRLPVTPSFLAPGSSVSQC